MQKTRTVIKDFSSEASVNGKFGAGWRRAIKKMGTLVATRIGRAASSIVYG